MTTDVSTSQPLDDRRRGEVFTYVGFDLDPEREPGRPAATASTTATSARRSPSRAAGDWTQPGGRGGRRGWCSCSPASRTTRRARRRSSTSATTAVTATERAFLRELLPRRARRVRLPQRPRPDGPADRRAASWSATRAGRLRPPTPGRPLIPFGGGIDSIVTVELLRAARRRRRRCSWSTGPATASPPSRTRPRSPGCRSCGPSGVIDEQVLRSRELGLPQRARAGHRDHLGDRRARRRAGRPRRGGDVERVVGVVGNARRRRPARSTTSTPRARRSRPRSAGVLAEALGGRPSSTSRCCGRSPSCWIARPVRRRTRSTSTTSAAATAPSTSTRRAGSTTGAGDCDKCCFIDLILAPFVPEPSLRRGLRAGAEPLADPALLETFRTLLGAHRRTRSRGSASATWTSAGSRLRLAADRAGPRRRRRCCARLVAEAAGLAPDPAAGRRCSRRRRRRTTSRTRYAARRSPGLTCAGAPGRRLGAGPRGRGQPARLPRPAASSRSWSTTRPQPADGLPVLATADGGLDALAGCDVVIKTPGHLPLRRRRSRRWSRRGRRGRRRPRPVARRSADRARVVCITGTKGKSTTTRDRRAPADRASATASWSAGNIGVPPYDPAVGRRRTTTGSSRCRATRPPTSRVDAAGRRRDVAAPRPPALARRRCRGLLPRQALAVHPARARTSRSPTATASCSASAATCSGPRVRWVHATDDPDARWTAPLGLLGAHNRRNALIARAVPRGRSASPGADDDGAARSARPRGSPAGEPAAGRRRRSTASTSSTTACRPTCCRRSPRSRRSRTAGSP